MARIGRNSWWEWVLILAIAIAIILRILNLDSREFWYDEVLSLLLSTGQKKLYVQPSAIPLTLADYKPLLSLPVENGFASIIPTGEKLLKGLVVEPHPPLFYIGQHLWLRLWGNSVAAMRSLPVLYSVGTIFCAYGWGRKLLGYRGGLLLAAALGLNPFFLFHSLNVRMYCGLVFWTVLSGWATLELVYYDRSSKNTLIPKNSRQIIWSIVLLLSITAGFLTFYYFCFWIASLGIFVVLLDCWDSKEKNKSFPKILLALLREKRWQRQALLSIGGVILTLPWLLWGTRQQLNNADLGRFKAGSNALQTAWQHIAGILTTLGVQIITGDWANILSPTIVNIFGSIAFILIAACIIFLWRKQQYTLLLTAFCFGLLPLCLMVLVDIVTGKFTVGFGFGRSLIFILPGCLLLLVTVIMKLKNRWQQITAIALLFFYLGISVTDFSLRSRDMFHDLADLVRQQPDTPTLIAMNSKAWGHVLRLVYYLPETAPVALLAQPTDNLNPALAEVLTKEPQKYQRIIWLDSDRPVWNEPSTEAEKQALHQTLERQFDLTTKTRVTGTWELDNFGVRVYKADSDNRN